MNYISDYLHNTLTDGSLGGDKADQGKSADFHGDVLKGVKKIKSDINRCLKKVNKKTKEIYHRNMVLCCIYNALVFAFMLYQLFWIIYFITSRSFVKLTH